MFKKIFKRIKNIVDDTEQIDEKFYADVMDEISQGFKDKALVGKAIVQSDGDESKFHPIYVKLRAEALQEKYREEYKKVQIEKQIAKAQKEELNKSIEYNYIKGKFHLIFKEEIQRLGFSSSLFAFNKFKKDGKTYLGKVNYDTMYYLIVDDSNQVIHRFKFSEK